MALDDQIDIELKDDTPTAQAVRQLINVQDLDPDSSNSDVELKTDLTEDQAKLHSVVDLLGSFLRFNNDFGKMTLLRQTVNKLERRFLSKDRKSRQEIVEIARQPDQMNFMPDASGSMTQRFFTGKKIMGKR